MPRLIIAREDELLVAKATDPEGEWEIASHLEMTLPVCVAIDPSRPANVYCGTFGAGLWRSDDGGDRWEWAGEGFPEARITAIAVSALEDSPAGGVVYAGTDPSAVYRSEDGGSSWRERTGLDELASASEWSFPPRPESHHVRWIECDRNREGWLYVSIEAGATIRSRNGGASWEDRVEGSPRDVHAMVTHPRAAGRLWAAAGDGYFESRDHGNNWTQPAAGLQSQYVWGFALDSRDPTIAIASAAAGPVQAHNPRAAYARMYRRVGDGRWFQLGVGLPDPERTTAHVLAANPFEPGIFYAVCNRGAFRSADGGINWTQLLIPWSEEDERRRVRAIAVVP
jgi:photosystem II stability/assembly factor-like uncharacterized protein